MDSVGELDRGYASGLGVGVRDLEAINELDHCWGEGLIIKKLEELLSPYLEEDLRVKVRLRGRRRRIQAWGPERNQSPPCSVEGQ